MENQNVTWEGEEPITKKQGAPLRGGALGRGGMRWGDPPPPSLVRVHGASRERISPYKRNGIAGGVISKWRLLIMSW